jgi:mannose-6-phosphate isomerase-like protein (cupin superfamily)
MKKYSLRTVISLFILLVILIFGNFKSANAESRGDTESLVKQSIMVWNTGNTAIAEQLYTTDITVHLVDQDNSELEGVKALMDYLSSIRTAYPDMKFEPDHMSIDGNKVITQMTFTGINTGPGLHYHTKMDEIFYIMEGKVEVTKGDEKIIATPGSLVRIPKLTHHGFHSIIGPARLLVTFIPGGGQVQYLYELGELMKSGSSWREGIGALQEKYDVHPL